MIRRRQDIMNGHEIVMSILYQVAYICIYVRFSSDACNRNYKFAIEIGVVMRRVEQITDSRT